MRTKFVDLCIKYLFQQLLIYILYTNLQFLEPQLEKLTGNIWIVDNVAGRLETNYITSGKKQSYLEEISEKFEDKVEMLENQQFRILKVNFKKFN